MVHEWNTATKYWANCSFPVKCECGKEIQSNSLFNHRKSKAHILEMQKPENKDNKPDLSFFWRKACREEDTKNKTNSNQTQQKALL